MRIPNVKPEQYELIKKLYYDDMKTQKDIGEIIGVSQKCICKLFERMDWTKRNKSESAKIKKYSSGLEDWRKNNGSWCKGLTKQDPKMKDLIERGRNTQIKNGKSKGSNNPMYGKVTNKCSGYRKDLGHFVRSSWEANFARILLQIGLNYEYEKHTFQLIKGDTYTPDFFIPSKNKFYEIKGWETTDKHHRFKTEYPNKKLSIISEKEYSRILKIFSNQIKISDGDSTYTRLEIIDLFLNYVKNNDKTISCALFTKSIGISNKTIIRLFGSEKQLVTRFSDDIKDIDISRCILNYINQREKLGHPPSRREFYKNYSRAANIINKYFGNFGNFMIVVSTN